jgi:hypothetical protein
MDSTIDYRLKGIELLNFSINAPNFPLPDKQVFQFDINIEYKINEKDCLLIVVVSISIKNQNKDAEYGKVRVSCIYELKYLSRFFDLENHSLSIPEDFRNALNVISISTTRGVMFTLFKGTFLHNAILPILNLNTLEEKKEMCNS